MPTASARDFKPLTWPRWTRIKAIIFPPVSDQKCCLGCTTISNVKQSLIGHEHRIRLGYYSSNIDPEVN